MNHTKLIAFVTLVMTLLGTGESSANVANMVCFYDAVNSVKEGPTQLSLTDLEPALQFCNYLIYGYATIDDQSYQLKPLNTSQSIHRDYYHLVTDLKKKFPHLRILLSIGGDRDPIGNGDATENKYLRLLEDVSTRQEFVRSATNVLRAHGFDGLDLAWQFPKNHPKDVKNAFKRAWSTFKGWFTGPKVLDEKAAEHKEEFTSLVRELRSAFRQDGFFLTLTVLPHVDPALFIDTFTVIANLDFVNLATFDFQTPERDPKVADYPAPLYDLYERDPTQNIHYQVQYWLTNNAPAHKINIGIAAYGRAWQMTKNSGITGYPPITETNGAAPPGPQSRTAGLLSWPEVCERLSTMENMEVIEVQLALRKVGDPTHRYGNYAYHAADEDGTNGIWVGYEDPSTAATKAAYVHAKGLGGVALFDLSMDDFKGRCNGDRYPILRSIKYKL